MQMKSDKKDTREPNYSQTYQDELYSKYLSATLIHYQLSFYLAIIAAICALIFFFIICYQLISDQDNISIALPIFSTAVSTIVSALFFSIYALQKKEVKEISHRYDINQLNKLIESTTNDSEKDKLRNKMFDMIIEENK